MPSYRSRWPVFRTFSQKTRAGLFLTKLSLVTYKLRQKTLQKFVLFTKIQIYANWQLQTQDVRLKNDIRTTSLSQPLSHWYNTNVN